jgi:hypothetical protein
MTITLQDPMSPRDPSSHHAFPDVVGEPPLTPPRTLAEELLAEFRGGETASETSFELASHGGYARTVVGTVAYVDEQAQAFAVRVRDGGLIRVPLRDVTSADRTASSEAEGSNVGRHVHDLGTGAWRTVDPTSQTARIG